MFLYQYYLTSIIIQLSIVLCSTSNTILDRFKSNRQPCLVPDYCEIALIFCLLFLMVGIGLI